jgi:hypothetical protein
MQENEGKDVRKCGKEIGYEQQNGRQWPLLGQGLSLQQILSLSSSSTST